jgi:hypothetical protein
VVEVKDVEVVQMLTQKIQMVRQIQAEVLEERVVERAVVESSY